MLFSQGYKDSNQENPIAETSTELDISSFSIQNAVVKLIDVITLDSQNYYKLYFSLSLPYHRE